MEKNVPKFMEKKVQQKPEPEQEPEQSQEPEQQEESQKDTSQEETEESEETEDPEESEDLEEKEETEEELARRIMREKHRFANTLNFNHQLLVSMNGMVNALESINTTLQENNKHLVNMGAVLEDLPENLKKNA